MSAPLLVELLTEELPPKALKKLGEAFAQGIADGLAQRKLLGADFAVTGFATPRRLAVLVTEVLAQGPDQARRDKVLPVSVAFDAAGKPQPPLLKKLAALGLDESAIAGLERASDGKADALFHNSVTPGESLAQGLQGALAATLASLPIPKVMFYERDDGTAVNFVRPAHRLIALHGSEVVPVMALGLTAGASTLGHRFLSSGEIAIADAASYADILRTQGHVEAGFEARKASIRAQLEALAKGDEVIAPEALLDEVTALVEWPVVYECHFDAAFLAVPAECLILTMQTNQKYFATRSQGKLTNRFLIVSNIATDDPSYIIGGNERVVRPRLADAKFFFDQDRKQTLESRLPKLANVVYHNKLGTQAARSARVTAIAEQIAALLGADVVKARRAATLAKADLLTDMVGEFPELQGIMGTYYALHDGEDAEVAQAITEHYQPRFAGDALPATTTGTILALADKLETLAGMFSIGAVPTGDKDPFALRRHALGVIRMLIEKDLALAVDSLVNAAYQCMPLVQSIGAGLENKILEKIQQEGLAGEHLNFASSKDLVAFIFDRLANMLREQGNTNNEVEAVLVLRPKCLGDIPRRLAAVRSFAALPEAPALAAANKRISNILKKVEGAVPTLIDPVLLVEPAEIALNGALHNVAPLANAFFENGEYTASLRELAALKGPVDAFFDGVMVNADDAALRNNRLALLNALHQAMNRVADLARLAG